MSRRNRRLRSGWPSLSGRGGSGWRHVDRANVVGSAPIITGTGFVLSRTVAIVVANASALTFLWGLVIGLAFATAGVAVLLSTDTPTRHSARPASVNRVPLATAAGVLGLSLLTGAVLGALL